MQEGNERDGQGLFCTPPSNLKLSAKPGLCAVTPWAQLLTPSLWLFTNHPFHTYKLPMGQSVCQALANGTGSVSAFNGVCILVRE